MRNILTILILSYLSFGLCCTDAMADGGRVVFMGQQDDYKICVFASPDPLRTGPVDLSVLIQDANTGSPVTTSSVSVSMTPSDGRGSIIYAVATNAAATNKLLSAAVLEIPNPGSWDVTIDCLAERREADVHFKLDVSGRWGNEVGVWPWFAWPVGVLILFGVHRRRVSQRKKSGDGRTN